MLYPRAAADNREEKAEERPLPSVKPLEGRNGMWLLAGIFALSPPLSLTRPLRSVSFSFCKRVPSRKRRAVASREKYKRRGNAVLSPFPDQKSFPTLCDESNKKNSRTLSRDVSDYSLSLPPSSLARSLALLFLSLLLPHAFETSRERERNEQKKKIVLNIKKEGRKNYKNKNGYSFSLSFSLSLSLSLLQFTSRAAPR